MTTTTDITTRTAPRADMSRLALLLATVLAGLSAGFFFTYEASVTLGLAEVGDVAYVETFQAINATIKNPVFGIVFFGSVPAIALAMFANRSSLQRRALTGLALALYLVGVGITFVGSVPMNDALAEYEVVTETTAAEARAEFEDDWNRLNLVRAVAFIASFTAVGATWMVDAASDDASEDESRSPAATGHTGRQ